MLLVFDVGNTNMVLGLYKGKELIKYWRITTDKYKTSDEYGILISNLFQYEKIDMIKIINHKICLGNPSSSDCQMRKPLQVCPPLQ